MSASPGRAGAASLVRRLVATATALLFVLPLIAAVSASLQSAAASATRAIDLFPRSPVWRNYRTVFEIVDLQRAIGNSLIVAGAAVPLTILVASQAGFAIARLSGRWRARLVLLSVLCLMVPLTAVWLPRFVLIKELGLMDRRAALVVPALMGTTPLYTLLFVWAFRRIPTELYDAARLDGAGPYRLWAQIAMPLARPVTVSVGVLSFVHYWNSFIEPLLYIRTSDRMTVSLALRVLYQLSGTAWPLIMTGAVVAMLPVLVIFLLAQPAFLQDRHGRGILGS